MTELSNTKSTYSFAGYTSIAGAISMVVGAAFWGASGTDLWAALAENQMESYLSQLGPVKHLLVAGTCFWTLGVLLLGTAGTLMSKVCTSKPLLAQVAKVWTQSAVSIGIISFFIMISLAIQPPSVDSAATIGWIGARMDDLATMLIIGISPLLLSISGKGDWVPGWLNMWGYLAGVAGILGIVGMLSGITALIFLVIPIGLGWMIAAGVVLVKKK